jgi:hypothetical protein
MVTNDARCTCEIKSRVAMARAAFNKKKTVFTSKLDINLKKKLVNWYIWSVALYGDETWTLWKVGCKYLEIFKIWYCRRRKKTGWIDCVKNEEVLLRDKEEREYPTHSKTKEG